MRFEAATTVPGDPESVWRWWTDYGEPGEVARVPHGLGASERRILSRESARIVMEDRWPALGRLGAVRHEVELDEDRLRIHERATKPLRYESWWRFEAEGEATRIRRVVELRTGIASGARGLVVRLARSLAQKDLDAHARRFVEDLRA